MTVPVDFEEKDLPTMSKAEFDNYSSNYEEALNQGIGVSGEDSSYFAEGRLLRLSKQLKQLNFEARSVIDFGCGVGNSLPYLRDLIGASRIAGTDISADSIAMARHRFSSENFELGTLQEIEANGSFDMAFCNGVFHHIPLSQRAASAALVYRHLKPGGLFAFFENNPLNPGTRYVMSRIPFDRDAITLTPWNARSLLTSAGFTVVRTDYLFYFPKMLSAFRPIEPWLRSVPFGAQYLVLCRK